MRISDWSSDVCSSDLSDTTRNCAFEPKTRSVRVAVHRGVSVARSVPTNSSSPASSTSFHAVPMSSRCTKKSLVSCPGRSVRSEEHTSELQSLMRSSYAVFCLKKKKKRNTITLNLKSTNKKTKQYIERRHLFSTTNTFNIVTLL